MDIGSLTGNIVLEDQMSAVLKKMDQVLAVTDARVRQMAGPTMTQFQQGITASKSKGTMF